MCPPVADSRSMADVFTKGKRSDIMTRIRGGNTLPERAVRKALANLGFSFRTHRKDLPGTPDFVMPGSRTAVFVHGCLWHQHKGCRRCSMPSSNVEYWRKKLERNVARFDEVRRELRRKGWRVFVVWECQTKDAGRLLKRLSAGLRADSSAPGCGKAKRGL